MKYCLFLLPVLLLLSCNSGAKQNELELFNGISLSLRPGEQAGEVTKAVKDDYFSNFTSQPRNLPLFRYIDGKDYKIFVGLPVNTDIKTQLRANLAGTDSSLTQSGSDSLSYLFRQYAQPGKYVTEYTFAEKEHNNMLYLLCVTSSKALSDSLFNREKLSGRIKLND